MEVLFQYLVNGVVQASAYMLVALGITLVFGLTRLINFAHGQFLVVAAFVASSCVTHGVPFYLAVVIAGPVGGALGLLTERVLFRWTLAKPLNGLIVSLGLLLILEASVLQFWGSDSVSVRQGVTGQAHFLGASLPYSWLIVFVVAWLLTVGFQVALRSTSLGRQLRAARADETAARHVGIRVGRMITLALILGSAFAGIAGPMLGSLYPIGPYDGGDLVLKGFAVALLGGLGNVRGAIVASVLYGLGESLVAGYLAPEWVPFFTYGVVIAVLLIRPGGLTNSAQAEESIEDSGGPAGTARRYARWEVTIFAVLLIVLPLVAFANSSGLIQATLTLAMLYSIQAYALSFIYVQTGIMSLAVASTMATGAYVGALLSIHADLGFWPSLPLAAGAGALVSAAIGLIVSRSKGHYMLLVTLACGALIYQLLNQWKSVTLGDQGLYLGRTVSAPFGIDLADPFGFFVFVCIGAAAAAALQWWVAKRTRLGVRFGAIRENQELAEALGMRTGIYKIIAFAISGAISGAGGIMFGYSQQFIGPQMFTMLLSVQFVMMMVFGGREILGPLAGALVITLLPQLVGLKPDQVQFAVGGLLIVVVLLLPQGVVPAVLDGYGALKRWGSRKVPLESDSELVLESVTANREELASAARGKVRQ